MGRWDTRANALALSNAFMSKTKFQKYKKKKLKPPKSPGAPAARRVNLDLCKRVPWRLQPVSTGVAGFSGLRGRGLVVLVLVVVVVGLVVVVGAHGGDVRAAVADIPALAVALAWEGFRAQVAAALFAASGFCRGRGRGSSSAVHM